MKSLILAMLLFPVLASAQGSSPFNNDINSLSHKQRADDAKRDQEHRQQKLADENLHRANEKAADQDDAIRAARTQVENQPAPSAIASRVSVHESEPSGPGTGSDELIALGIKMRKQREARAKAAKKQ
jgi:hypothetical protein